MTYDPGLENTLPPGHRPAAAPAASLDLIVHQLASVAAAVDKVDSKVEKIAEAATPREVWQQRNNLVDTNFVSVGREIGQIRAELNARRTPVTNVLAICMSAVSLVVLLAQNIPA